MIFRVSVVAPPARTHNLAGIGQIPQLLSIVVERLVHVPDVDPGDGEYFSEGQLMDAATRAATLAIQEMGSSISAQDSVLVEGEGFSVTFAPEPDED